MRWLKRLYNLYDEQMEYPLLDRMSYQRFCRLTHSSNIADRTTIWTFESRIGETGAQALFDGVADQLMRKGYMTRGGQIIDATLVPAPRQQIRRHEKEIIEQQATPADWKPAQRRQKDLDASWTKKHGKSHVGYKLSINVDKRYKVIRAFKSSTASVHDSRHFHQVLDPCNTRMSMLIVAMLARRGKRSSCKAAMAPIFSAKGHATARCPSAKNGVTTASP
jgi:IS5 family transposase